MYQSPMVTNDDRLWGMLGHITAAIGLVVGAGLLQWAGPLVVWLVKRESSPFAAFHGLQSLLFQLMWLGILLVAGVVGGVLSMLTFGLGLFVLVPVLIVLGLVPVVWSVLAGLKANAGEWYEYPVVGAYARRSLGL